MTRHRKKQGQEGTPPLVPGSEEPSPSASANYERLGLALVVAAALLAFAPVLRNGFVNWDDDVNLLNNLNYRGLGWPQLKWMFTTCFMGPYQPLSWLSLGADYAVWGMNPAGYHLTSLILHAANAAIFYFVNISVLALALPKFADRKKPDIYIAAAFAALVFAVHPLRAESVAWATERRDVLSGLFYLLTILFYLRGQLWRSLLAFALSLLAKATGVTLPVILLVLDVFPLRRLPEEPKRWFAPEFRKIWLEKTPYLLLALILAWVGYRGQAASGAMWSNVDNGEIARVTQAAYSLAFYAWKTAMPFRLTPMYERPTPILPWVWPFWPAVVFVLVVTFGFFQGRRRWPAGAALWMFYGMALAPVSGITRFGQQLAADRYSYLPCLAWAALAGGILLSRLRTPNLALRKIPLIAAAGLVAGLGFLTWRQSLTWRDSESLWRHVLSVNPRHVFANNNLGTILSEQGKLDEAAAHLETAIQANPSSMLAQYNLGNVLARLGRRPDAIVHYREALRQDPGYLPALNNLGFALSYEGRLPEAADSFREALRRDPTHEGSRFGLAAALAQQGKLDEAIENFRIAAQENPKNAVARSYLGSALADKGRTAEAIENFEAALKIDPNCAEAHNGWAIVLLKQGKVDQSIAHFREALRVKPDYAPARRSLDIILGRMGKNPKPPP
ncbi:MAG: tetratricopeptide repeat protein [Elusimicrobiota bacterium]